MKIGDEDYPLDAEGFLQEPARWNREVALAIAQDEGIDDMSDRHWAVVEFIRRYWEQHDTAPPVRLLCQETSVGVREMHRLFHSGPARGACRIAGLPKPDGCV
ncbi:MAG: TusE/DsrC/DsvC family sulfur relay protein [Acidobacteria bacterium]|nr:TusE/DsrC/DsvC family sulfur relay protein [Acidobacteriota bacterium]